MANICLSRELLYYAHPQFSNILVIRISSRRLYRRHIGEIMISVAETLKLTLETAGGRRCLVLYSYAFLEI